MTTDPDLEEPPSAGAGSGLTLELAADDVDPPADRWLLERLKAAVRGAGLPEANKPVSLAILVVDDAEMSRLHRLHSGVDGTTDVLTFDNRDDAGGPIDGDLVLCRDEAVRRATEFGHDARVELLLYAVHGLLHLAGEDDHDPAAHRRMHDREDRILSSIGIGPVFSAREARSPA